MLHAGRSLRERNNTHIARLPHTNCNMGYIATPHKLIAFTIKSRIRATWRSHSSCSMHIQQSHSHLNTDSPSIILEACFVSSCAPLTLFHSRLGTSVLFFFFFVFVPSVKKLAMMTQVGSCEIRTRQILEVATLSYIQLQFMLCSNEHV